MESNSLVDFTSATGPALDEQDLAQSALDRTTPPSTDNRRASVRRAGLRRHSSRAMREIIKALAESVAGMSQEEQQTMGHTGLQASQFYSRPAQLSPHHFAPDLRDQRTENDDDGDGDESGDVKSQVEPFVSRPPRIKLLRSQDLWSEPQINTELNCDYCGCLFHLQQSGASFEGKAACGSCEQQLNRDIVLPTVRKIRAQAREVCDISNGPEHPNRPA